MKYLKKRLLEQGILDKRGRLFAGSKKIIDQNLESIQNETLFLPDSANAFQCVYGIS